MKLLADAALGCGLVLGLFFIGELVADGAEPNAQQPESNQPADKASQVDYLRDIKPLLAQHCSGCHGAKKQLADLRLDTVKGGLIGGESGTAIEPGNANNSLLIKAISGDEEASQMPPEEYPQLTKQQVALLTAWVNQGAKAPKDEVATIANSDHWAFQPVVRPALPAVKQSDWPRTAIDYFILARLEKEGIAPSPEADRTTQIRRLYLDLLGVLPPMREVEVFVADESPDAYHRLVERLLASPAYGERWGRRWLDLARYADSNGYTRDFGRQIWKYRDWVIEAVNRDLAFDQFTIEQFAGDMLPNATLQQKIATGFHRNTLTNDEGGTDQEQFRVEAVVDRVATTGVVYLGLTLGCARCHEHKFDPISQREFYQIFAFLNDCDEPSIDAPFDYQISQGDLVKRKGIRDQIAKLEKQLKKQQAEFESKQQEWEKTVTPEQRSKWDGPTQAAFDKAFERRDADQKKLVATLYKKTKHALNAVPVLQKISDLRSSEPKIPTTMVMKTREKPRETFLHRRGNFLDPGARVYPKTPDILHPLPQGIENPNRLDFARWLVDSSNPLTPRVVINRYWQDFFGRGIVLTENDFGLQGSPPTHPQALDWLAAEFVEQQWSVKAIHRLIITSAVYRQSSQSRPELNISDSGNELLSHQNRIRLDAEIIRDAALTASGLLDRTMGGPSVFPPQPAGVYDFTQDQKNWKTTNDQQRFRRGMYTFFWRSSPYPAMIAFDFPTSNVTCTRRIRSNTPLQSLTMANDAVFMECSQRLARRILAESQGDDSARLQYAFGLCMARQPSKAELKRLSTMLAQQKKSFAANPEQARAFAALPDDEQQDAIQLAAWTAISRVLINLDEFITRE